MATLPKFIFYYFLYKANMSFSMLFVFSQTVSKKSSKEFYIEKNALKFW